MIDLESQYLLFRHASENETHPDGTLIFDQSDEGHVMYIVKSGAVRIFVDDVFVYTVRTGEPFGEMALIDESRRSARAVCEGTTELIPIDVKRFRFLVQASPDVSLAIMRTMAERLRSMNRRVGETS